MKTANPIATSSLKLPNDSYIYKIVPTNTRLAAISSDDSLRIIDPRTLQEAPRGTWNNVHAGVTCLQTDGSGSGLLLTAGRDAVVRSWDVRSGQKVVEFKDEGQKAPFLSLTCCNNAVAAGTELSHHQATIHIWDRRNPSQPFLQYVESHNDDITEILTSLTLLDSAPYPSLTSLQLSFHPTIDSLLLSGSTDDLINIYDTSQTDEDDALIQITNQGSSIHRADFLSKDQFFGLSHDEAFSIYDLESQDGPKEALAAPVVFGDLREPLGCEYVVDVAVSGGVETVVLGAGSHSKQYLDLVPLRQNPRWAFDQENTIRLAGAHGQEIVRSICFDHQTSTIFTAGEDGMIRAWQTPNASEERKEANLEEAKEAPTRRRKDSEKGQVGKSRYQPY